MCYLCWLCYRLWYQLLASNVKHQYIQQGSLDILHAFLYFFFNVFTLPPPPSLSVDCNKVVPQRFIMPLSVDHRAQEVPPRLFVSVCGRACPALWVREFVYAKTRRASVGHRRVMHALSQVDSRRECVLHSGYRAWQFHAPRRVQHSPRCNTLWSWRQSEALREWEVNRPT